MFNTYQPLDILYLDVERGVVNALRMEPCPEVKRKRGQCVAQRMLHRLRAITDHNADAGYALELPAGWLEGNGWDLWTNSKDLR